VIARRIPSLRLSGLDISPASVAVGSERFAELGLGNIALIEGQADDLSGFENASADVVFTDAVLMLVGPDKIQSCIEEMIRVARRSIILLEMHIDGVGFGGTYTRDGWVRDYKALFKQLGYDIKLVRMPPEVRPAGRWPKYGAYIEVRLQ
jgi:ubiquinone/menaquinone biosynthesis C-methylase UbiE